VSRIERCGSLKLPALALIWLLAFVVLSGSTAAASLPPNTIISVRAEASYQDQDGNILTTSSETVTIIVGTASGVTVTPDDSAPSSFVPPQDRATQLLTVCNTGNQTDSFIVISTQITAPASLASLHFNLDGSGTLKPADPLITIGQTSSPLLNADACIGILADVDGNGAALGSLVTLQLTARSNQDSRVEDQGTILLTVGTGPKFSSLTDANRPPLALVDGQSSTAAVAGQKISFSITLTNSGDISAKDVVVTDDLPAGFEYVPGSMLFGVHASTSTTSIRAAPNSSDESLVVGRHVEVHLPEVGQGEIATINFQVLLSGLTLQGGGVFNHAVINARNIAAPVATTEVMVVVNPIGIVYVGNSGGSVKVKAATVILSTDQLGANPIALAPATGLFASGSNQNPVVTNERGEFDFVLSPAQLGTDAQPETYFVSVAATGFLRRVLQVTVHGVGNQLFALTVQALDNQPIAQGGSFVLTSDAVQLNDLALLVLNIPMFETASLQIAKVADKQRATIGDVVSYSIETHNTLVSPLTEILVRDRLPASFNYAAGTGRLITAGTSIAIEPEIGATEMIFRIGSLDPGARATISYRVRVGVNAIQGEQFNSASAEGIQPSGQKAASAQARVAVFVGQGIFGMDQVIIGRVFEDINLNGIYDKGDLPAPKARLYLGNGDSSVTDSEGMYNFPNVKGGSIVITLDEFSLPAGYKLMADNVRSDKSWARLLRTPLGGGSMIRQNFAVLPSNRAIAARLTEPDVPKETKGKGPLATGTYEVEAADEVVLLVAGAVRINSPAANQVILSPAMTLSASVYEDWTVALEVNGQKIADSQIGERHVDHKNKLSTFIFFGLNLRPGPNSIEVTAIDPTRNAVTTVEAVVFGRGPTKRLEINAGKQDMFADGIESTEVHVLAFDQWEHAAADEQILVETSSGILRPPACAASGICPTDNLLNGKSSTLKTQLATLGLNGGNNVAAFDPDRQQSVSLRGGEARLVLIAGHAPGKVELRALMGVVEGRTSIRFLPEVRPAILVGLVEGSIGRAAPDRSWQDQHGIVSDRVSLFYRGSVFAKNLLTIAYDSHSRLHQVEGQNRMSQLDPQDRIYPLFGDSSTRFEDAPSNSKLYARLDRGSSFLLFGDFNPDRDGATDLHIEGNNAIQQGSSVSHSGVRSDVPRMLTGYSRTLTGMKIHGENHNGDTLTLTGALPDTAFARDVFPGGFFGLLRLSQIEILPGSENVVLEVRDRRNPEIILSQDPLVRSADYNIDANTGSILLLRRISSFDYALNLLQIVVTYEYFAHDLSSAVYTARAGKVFSRYGLRMSPSLLSQRQTAVGAFNLAGADLQKTLPRGGVLLLEWGMSHGRVASAGNLLSPGPGSAAANSAVNGDNNGNAFRAELTQPLSFYKTLLKAAMVRVDESFLNPFGATVTPGSQRASVEADLKPVASGMLHVGFVGETNKTINVDNQRLTASAGWTQTINARFKVSALVDRRQFTDQAAHGNILSNLVTAGGEWRPTGKLTVAVKREQNLGQADPTYPNQTTLAASLQVKPLTRIYFTQRLAAAPIVPISDSSATGFASSNARQETALGVETHLGRYTSLNNRYQIENGITGSDSFAVLGFVSRLPVRKNVSLDFGFDRGEHLTGTGSSFESGSGGLSWLPTKNFRSTARYELRDRDGFGQIVTVGAAGKLGENVTAMGSVQGSKAEFSGLGSSTMNGTATLAVRPLHSDFAALLFSYNLRSTTQSTPAGLLGVMATVERTDILSSDGLLTLTKQIEFYGRLAVKFGQNGRPDLTQVSTLTYMAQWRLQERFSKRFDAAAEFRWLAQPVTKTRRTSIGSDIGFWLLPDLRLGVGRNWTGVREPEGNAGSGLGKTGFYFTVSSKLSNLFNLFGTSNAIEAGRGEPGDKKK